MAPALVEDVWSDDDGEDDDAAEVTPLPTTPAGGDMIGNGGGLFARLCEMEPPDGFPTTGKGGASDRTEPDRDRVLLLPDDGRCKSLCRGVAWDALCGVLGRGGIDSRCCGKAGSGGEYRCG